MPFLAVHLVWLHFVIVVFPDHTPLLFVKFIIRIALFKQFLSKKFIASVEGSTRLDALANRMG